LFGLFQSASNSTDAFPFQQVAILEKLLIGFSALNDNLSLTVHRQNSGLTAILFT
jgi:hypothetical protein